MNKLETVEEAAQQCNMGFHSALTGHYDSFIAGAKWQQEQHESLYKSIREFRNELRDKYESADLLEGGQLKQQIKGIDMILTKFEQL